MRAWRLEISYQIYDYRYTQEGPSSLFKKKVQVHCFKIVVEYIVRKILKLGVDEVFQILRPGL